MSFCRARMPSPGLGVEVVVEGPERADAREGRQRRERRGVRRWPEEEDRSRGRRRRSGGRPSSASRPSRSGSAAPLRGSACRSPARAQQADVRGMRMTTSAKASSRPLDQLDRHGSGASPSSSRSAATDQRSSAIAARRLDQDDVTRRAAAGASTVERVLLVGDATDPGRVEAGRDRAIGDPARLAGPPRPASSQTRPAASPTSRWPRSCASPSSSISPRTAHAPAGQTGEQLEGREHRIAAMRCSCRR